MQIPAITASGSASPNPSPSTLDAKAKSIQNGCPSHRSYAPDASIVLIGIRRAGRSTLALLASSSLRFNLVDTDTLFLEKMGASRSAYAATFGNREYRRQELALMRSVLNDYSTRAVIAGSLASVEGVGQQLMLEYGKTHPVIYILRDPEDIAQHIGSCDCQTISDLLLLASPIFRSLSSFEFYNLSDLSLSKDSPEAESNSAKTPSLLLKKTERDFLHLIYSIRGQRTRLQLSKARHSLSAVPPEKRQFTYALSIHHSQVCGLTERLSSVDLLADAVELVVDMTALTDGDGVFSHAAVTTLARQFYALRRSTVLPVIIHIRQEICRSPSSSNSLLSPCLAETYILCLRYCLRLAPEYLTINLDLPDQHITSIIATSGNTKIIGHFFDPCPGINAWEDVGKQILVERAQGLGCHIARLCQPALSNADNWSALRLLSLLRTSGRVQIPVIAYNSGPKGRMSCFLNSVLTPVTHPLIQNTENTISNDLSRWLLTIPEAQNALYASFTLNPQFFGIFGTDVITSLSPTMYTAAFRHYRVPHRYKALQCTSLKDLEPLLQDPSFGGASITAPFKNDIITVIDYLSQAARAIGAVNTLLPLRSSGPDALIQRNEQGRIVALYGENTDWIGIYTCIRRNLSPVNTIKSRTTALVLGAGGMAYATVYSMIRLGIRSIFVCNRTQERAQLLAERFSGKTYALDHSSTAGMFEHPEKWSQQVCGPSTVHVIRSLEEPWPTNFDPPTVIVSNIPARSTRGQPQPNVTMQGGWLASQTGGVVVEVSGHSELPALLTKSGRSEEFANIGV